MPADQKSVLDSSQSTSSRLKFSFPSLLIFIGVSIALFSLLADFLGVGSGGIQAAQILLAELGLIVACLGFFLIRLNLTRGLSPGQFLSLMIHKILDLPALVWVMTGILPSLILFIVVPMFFNEHQHVRYIVDILPKGEPVGSDLRNDMHSAQYWFQEQRISGFLFTPIKNILFYPLILLAYPINYYVISLVTLLFYVISVWLAILISTVRLHPLIVFIGALSLFSFGALFELEMGQYYTITFTIALLSAYIFHKYPDFRLFAYFLFCLAVQLKFKPALLVFLLIENWRDWKQNLIRLSALGLTNFLALFIFGLEYASTLFTARVDQLQTTGEFSIRNHSIWSSTAVFGASGLGILNENAMRWIQDNYAGMTLFLAIFYFLCLAAVLANSYINNERGLNVDLLLICVIGTMILPTISHDYTLPILTIPFALSIANWSERSYPFPRILLILITIITGFAYSITLFPFQYKPEIFQNNLPMFYVILTAVTTLNLLSNKPSSAAAVNSVG